MGKVLPSQRLLKQFVVFGEMNLSEIGSGKPSSLLGSYYENAGNASTLFLKEELFGAIAANASRWRHGWWW